MKTFEEFINSEKIYEYKWLKYGLYSNTCYKLVLDHGLYIIINEKENYLNMKTDYIVMLYIESGHSVYTIHNVKIDKKRLKCIDIDDYISTL